MDQLEDDDFMQVAMAAASPVRQNKLKRLRKCNASPPNRRKHVFSLGFGRHSENVLPAVDAESLARTKTPVSVLSADEALEDEQSPERKGFLQVEESGDNCRVGLSGMPSLDSLKRLKDAQSKLLDEYPPSKSEESARIQVVNSVHKVCESTGEDFVQHGSSHERLTLLEELSSEKIIQNSESQNLVSSKNNEEVEESSKSAGTSCSKGDEAVDEPAITFPKQHDDTIAHIVAKRSKKIEKGKVRRKSTSLKTTSLVADQEANACHGLSKPVLVTKNRKAQKSEGGEKEELNHSDEEALLTFLQKESEIIKADRERSVKISTSKPKKSGSSSAAPQKSKKHKEELSNIHVESQRLLRETKGVAFTPQPAAQKSIQNVLERIRLRKNQHLRVTCNTNTSLRALGISTSEHCKYEDVVLESEHAEVTIDAASMDAVTVGDSYDTRPQARLKIVEGLSGKNKELALSELRGSDASPSLLEENKSNFDSRDHNHDENVLREPIDDTQDLFSDSQIGLDDQLEENPVNPSIGLGIALHLDTETQDEDFASCCKNDFKIEMVTAPSEQPIQHMSRQDSRLKDFVDDEAEEDEDFRCESGDEDENINDDIDNLTAPPEEEDDADRSKRSKLHQKWLEQQDDAMMDDILLRLKTGWQPRGVIEPKPFLYEDFGNSDGCNRDVHSDEKTMKSHVNCVDLDTEQNCRMDHQDNNGMQKEIHDIVDTVEQSDSSEDEEVEESLFRQRLLKESEEQEAFLSPAEDDTSREVLGLINKVNVPPIKSKPVTGLSDIRTYTTIIHSSGNSKSSFLGRSLSSSLPTSHKQGLGNSRSFIFGRDDSNSSHSFPSNENLEPTLSKDASSDEGWKKSWKTRGEIAPASPFTESLNKISTGSSLFEILKRQSTELDKGLKEQNTNIITDQVLPFRNISMFSKSYRQSKPHKRM